jgi:nucleoside-diphosphate-sugar epimerase
VGGSKFLQNMNFDKSFLLNNIKIISNIFEMLMEFDKKVIFISSYLTSDISHSYGLLKSLGEKFTHSIHGIVLRLYNFYGDEEVSYRSNVIPDLINQAQNNIFVELKTNGDERRQFLYIDDCCEALFIASQKYDELLNECNCFDLTSFEWVKIKKVAK